MAARRDRLIKRRAELGYSQEALAVRIGSDRTTIGRLERGETDPYPHTRSKLCAALLVTPGELDRLLVTDPESPRTAVKATHAISGDVMSDPQPTAALDMYRRELLRLSLAASAGREAGAHDQWRDNRLPTTHWVAAVQATTYASLGDLDRCENALDTAGEVAGISRESIPGGWLRFDDSRLTEERGTCVADLNDRVLHVIAAT
ncbi:helix-turn-helix transcriptional regulator [Actinoplanes sandaracinus]|nr:helix-turn-helix transcriptional regulator [Actinoplanes sandaracinus]